MTKRNVKGRGVGFYVMIEEDSNEEVEERCLEVKEGDLEVDVFKVERVVERRTKKVSGCLQSVMN